MIGTNLTDTTHGGTMRDRPRRRRPRTPLTSGEKVGAFVYPPPGQGSEIHCIACGSSFSPVGRSVRRSRDAGRTLRRERTRSSGASFGARAHRLRHGRRQVRAGDPTQQLVVDHAQVAGRPHDPVTQVGRRQHGGLHTIPMRRAPQRLTSRSVLGAASARTPSCSGQSPRRRIPAKAATTAVAKPHPRTTRAMVIHCAARCGTQRL